MTDMNAPTVVLVHGSFADASSWAGVTQRLELAGVPVKAIVNPLRGINADSAYVASAMDQVPGPVLAVGHSYGGAVITNAATKAKNVVGLVYVAGVRPRRRRDSRGHCRRLEGQHSDDCSPRDAVSDQPRLRDIDQEYSIDPAKFHEVFTADLSLEESDVLAVFPAADRLRNADRKVWRTRVEEPLQLGGRRDCGQGDRNRRRTVDGRARRGRHHRGQRLPRGHDLPAGRRHRSHPQSTQVGQLTRVSKTRHQAHLPRFQRTCSRTPVASPMPTASTGRVTVSR